MLVWFPLCIRSSSAFLESPSLAPFFLTCTQLTSIRLLLPMDLCYISTPMTVKIYIAMPANETSSPVDRLTLCLNEVPGVYT